MPGIAAVEFQNHPVRVGKALLPSKSFWRNRAKRPLRISLILKQQLIIRLESQRGALKLSSMFFKVAITDSKDGGASRNMSCICS